MTHCISAQTNTCNVVANSRFTFGCKRKISDVLYSIILSGIYSSTMARVHSILRHQHCRGGYTLQLWHGYTVSSGFWAPPRQILPLSSRRDQCRLFLSCEGSGAWDDSTGARIFCPKSKNEGSIHSGDVLHWLRS